MLYRKSECFHAARREGKLWHKNGCSILSTRSDQSSGTLSHGICISQYTDAVYLMSSAYSYYARQISSKTLLSHLTTLGNSAPTLTAQEALIMSTLNTSNLIYKLTPLYRVKTLQHKARNPNQDF